MKVLHITPAYKPAFIYGGPIASVSKLCESETRNGVKVQVASTNANGENKFLDVETEEFLLIDNVPVRYFKSQRNDNAFISFPLWKFLIKNCKKYDIIHIHSWWNLLAIVSCVICLQKKVKVVLSPRGMLSQYIFNSGKQRIKKIIHFIIGKQLLSKCTFHATSDQEYSECKSLIKGWKGFNIPNMIELPPLEITRKQNCQFTMTFLSRIHPKKGIEFLFQAMSILNFTVTLRIAGEGDEEYIAKLKDLAEKLGISENVEWIGWCGPVEKFHELMSTDLFVLTSYNENFANVVIESLYVGTPVLISKHVGLSNFVKKNDLGWITDLDSKSIAKLIGEAKMNSEKRLHINNNSRRIIINNFSEDVLGRQYINAYTKTIN